MKNLIKALAYKDAYDIVKYLYYDDYAPVGYIQSVMGIKHAA